MGRLLWLAGLIAACTPAARGGEEASATGGGPAPSSESGDVPKTEGRGASVLYRAEGPLAYTVERRDSLVLMLPGGAQQVQTIDRTAFVRVTLGEGPDSFPATIVLDSVRSATLPPDSLFPAFGTRWTATLSPSGELTGLTASRSTTVGDQVGSALRLLFPVLPPGGVRDEATWSDTTDYPLKADAFNATERAVTDYTAAEAEADGKKSLRIESTAAFSRTGTGSQGEGGQPLEMSSTGTRRITHLLGYDGRLVSAQGSDSSAMEIRVPAVGQTVPVTQRGTLMIHLSNPSPR